MCVSQAEGIAEARSGRRSPWSVWGSGIAALVCAIAALATGDFDFWQVRPLLQRAAPATRIHSLHTHIYECAGSSQRAGILIKYINIYIHIYIYICIFQADSEKYI